MLCVVLLSVVAPNAGYTVSQGNHAGL